MYEMVDGISAAVQGSDLSNRLPVHVSQSIIFEATVVECEHFTSIQLFEIIEVHRKHDF